MSGQEASRHLFAARREDGRAEWKVVYDRVARMDYGDLLPFAELAELLASEDKSRAYRAVRECNRHLLKSGAVPRYLVPERGLGYRVLRPEDYTPVALVKKDIATRKLSEAVDLMKSAPLREMSPQARAWAEQVTMHLADHELRMMGMEQRQAFADERLSELERRAGIGRPPVLPGRVD